MRRILIVGIGAGDPGFLTLQAIGALKRADVVFLPLKGEEKSGLNAIRVRLLEHAVPAGGYRVVRFEVPERRIDEAGPYKGSIDDWRGELLTVYRDLFATELGTDQTGAFLVWGDPSLYDGTLTLIEEIGAQGIVLNVEVIPGISAVQALAAAHRVALNRVGEAVTVTTGRRVAAGCADDLSSFVVMLDSQGAWRRFAGEEATIYWGAYLGTPDQILVSGRIADVQDEIERVRQAAKQRHGWIMDTYFIRRAER